MINTIAILGKIPLFKGLKATELQKINKIARIKEFTKNQIIFSENSLGTSLFIILTGKVKIFAEHKGKKKIFTYIAPGEFFGELALIDDPIRTASAQALSDTEVLTINRDEFKKILTKHPDMTYNLMKILAKRLRFADKEIESLSFCNVFTRVVKSLIALSKKYGKTVPEGKLIDIKLDNEELAELTGTVREVIIRVLKQLDNLGCVKHAPGRKILLTNENKLITLIN